MKRDCGLYLDDIVWKTIKERLPELKPAIKKLLELVDGNLPLTR